MIYTTVQGDMFDTIALKTIGSEKYADEIMKHNPKYRSVYVFESGIELSIPDIDISESTANKMPWRQVMG